MWLAVTGREFNSLQVHSMLNRLKERHKIGIELFKEGFIAGLGWAAGVTIGFVVVSSLVVFILNQLGGIPFIGGWIAEIVDETEQQLLRRSPLAPR